MSPSQTSLQRQRSRKKRGNRLIGTVRTAPELLWLAVGLVGVVLLTSYPQARRAMLNAAGQTADVVKPAAISLKQLVVRVASDVTLIELLGFALVIAGMTALLYRLRWRIMHAAALSQLACPRCGNEIHRVHRKELDRAISIAVPVRRYRCWNKECGWEGLRVNDGSARRPASLPAQE